MQLALKTITTTVTALPLEVGKNGSGQSQCSPVGISQSRAQQVRAAFDTANLVPEAIDYIDPKVC